MVVPRLEQAAAVVESGSGPAPPSVYTYVTNRNASNNVFWFDASAYPRLIDLGIPGATNVVATLKYIFHVDAILLGTRALCANAGGPGGFQIQGGYATGSNYRARIFTEDNLGVDQLTPFASVPTLVGNVIVVHACWDASGQRIYINGANEEVRAFTSGYGQFNLNGGFVLGGAANRSGYFDGSTLAVSLSIGVDIIACSLRKGVALSAAEVASDFAATSPASLHLASANHAFRPDPSDATSMLVDAGVASLTFNTTDPLDPPLIGTVAP